MPILTASMIAVVGGNTQTGVVGRGLTTPFIVKVTNQNGAAMSGVLVNFTATSGASLKTSSAITDATGQATDSVTLLGTIAGAGTVTASVSGVATPAIFHFTANAGAAASLIVVSGNNQTGTAGTALASPLVVKVTDSFGNVVVNAMVNWTTTAGAIAGTAQSTSDATGTAQAALMLPAVAGAVTVTATLQGTATTALFIEMAM